MRRFLFSLAAFTIVFAGLTLPCAAGEKQAIEAFKADLKKVNAEATAKEGQHKTDTASSVVLMRQMCRRLRAVRTEGLPPDLKAAYLDTLTSLGKFEKAFEGFPESAEEFQAYLQEKVNADPGFPRKLQSEVAEAAVELQPKVTALDTIGKKYGVENLGALGNGVGR